MAYIEVEFHKDTDRTLIREPINGVINLNRLGMLTIVKLPDGNKAGRLIVDGIEVSELITYSSVLSILEEMLKDG